MAWLPDATEPVVCGRLERRAERFTFSCGRSYRERPDAVPKPVPPSTCRGPQYTLRSNSSLLPRPRSTPANLSMRTSQLLLSMQTIVAAQHFSYVEFADEIRACLSTLTPVGNDSHGRESRVAALIGAAPIYHLTAAQGREIADHQIEVIQRQWDEVCDTARLTDPQRKSLLAGPILNPYAFYS